MVEALKDPVKVKAGQAGARSRWGPQRIVRLDNLDPDTQRLIRALLAQSEAKASESEGSS
jgi:hypothetical protein